MEHFWKNCKSQYKASFFGAVIIGVICYFYAMSHHFLTYDSMWNLYSDQDMIASGRQFLTYACSIGSYFDLPALNGFLSIFYLALTSVLIVDIFGVNNIVTAILIGGFITVFPSVSYGFCYTYTIDGYMLAVLIITLAFYITNRYKYGFLAGILLTGISIGIYQAFYAYLIVLCIIWLLLFILNNDDHKLFFKKALSFVIIGVGGYLFYAVTLKLMLLIKHTGTSGYKGTDKVLSFSLSSVPEGIVAAIRSAVAFAVKGNALKQLPPMKIAYCGLVLCGIVLFIGQFIKKKKYKSPFNIVMTILLVAVLPLGLNVITILAPEAFFHLLMRYAWVLLFVFVLVLSENTIKSLTLTVRVLSVVMVFCFVVMANILAFTMEEKYERTFALCNRIVNRLEQTEGYRTGMPVAIIGGNLDRTFYQPVNMTDNYLADYFVAYGDYCVASSADVASFCRRYIGVVLHVVPQEKEIELALTDEFAKMHNYPNSDSIRQIDGVWVIKWNDVD